MPYNLADIAEFIEKHVALVSNVTKTSVEIINISGEVLFSSSQELKAYQRFPQIYKTISESKNQICILNHEDPILKDYKDLLCIDYFIATPIIIDDEVVACIGAIRYQRETYYDLESHQQFLLQMADFIATKWREHEDNENLYSMLSMLEIATRNMDEGAIVINNKNEIDIINNSAKRQLNITRTIKNESIEIKPTGDTVNNSDEFVIKIGSKSCRVVGALLNIPKNKYYSKILLFRDLKKIQSNIYAMTSTINASDMDSIIGSSESTQLLKNDILKVADSISTVLITGESGTGKEMVATAIWKNSSRRDERFVAINCAAIPEPLLESELFGYIKGAFTGADPNGRMGKFELANKGVIFLDEIGDMPIYLQSKLLRVIQEKKITRIGSNQIIPLDVRIIAATNKDLKQMILQNKFREDLYYRLNVIPFEITPLRARKEDIEDLLYYYIEYYRKLFSKSFDHITDEALEILMHYSWPGNVRELENAVEYMVNMMERGIIRKQTLPHNVLIDDGALVEDHRIIPLKDLEIREIEKAIQQFGDDTKGKEHAAKALGIGIATLYRKLKEFK